jgi:aconitate hydratase 2/2-methylisocitrate dehydratase
MAAVAALLGKIPTKEEYMSIVNKKITDANKESVYKYLNFDKVSSEQLEAMVK